MTMEYAAFGNFRKWLESQADTPDGRLTLGVELFRQACLGVLSVHKGGYAHLDLKPENILLCSDEDGKPIAKVADLGIARGRRLETRHTALTVLRGRGTPTYQSPEQFSEEDGAEVGPSSDIYSLGVVLYEILMGEPPFEGTRAELAEQHCNATPAPLRGRAEKWWPVVERCLKKSPGARFKDVAELLGALAAAQAAQQTGASEIACPQCGQSCGHGSDSKCGQCGADLSRLLTKCPRCSERNLIDAETCRYCGFGIASHGRLEADRKRVAEIKDVDPAAAIELLEKMLGNGGSDRDAALLQELRERMRKAERAISRADSARKRGDVEEEVGAWGDVLGLFPRHALAMKRVKELKSRLESAAPRPRHEERAVAAEPVHPSYAVSVSERSQLGTVVRVIFFMGLAAALVAGGVWLWGGAGQQTWSWIQQQPPLFLYIGGGALVALLVPVIAIRTFGDAPAPPGELLPRMGAVLLVIVLVCGSVFGAIWLWGWSVEFLWPWCVRHPVGLIVLTCAFLLLQATIHKARNTDAAIEMQFSKLVLLPVVAAVVLVAVSAVVALFVFDAHPGHGATAGLMARRASRLGRRGVRISCSLGWHIDRLAEIRAHVDAAEGGGEGAHEGCPGRAVLPPRAPRRDRVSYIRFHGSCRPGSQCFPVP